MCSQGRLPAVTTTSNLQSDVQWAPSAMPWLLPFGGCLTPKGPRVSVESSAPSKEAAGDVPPFCSHSISLHSTWPYPDGRGAGKCGCPGRRGRGFGEHMALSLTHGYANSHTDI